MPLSHNQGAREAALALTLYAIALLTGVSGFFWVSSLSYEACLARHASRPPAQLHELCGARP